MIRLEAFLAALLDSQQDAERRQLLHRYLIWHLIRRLRSRNNGSPATRQQSLMIRRLARGAIAFLDWLDAHDLTLNSCQQADPDRSRTDERAAYREGKPAGSSAGPAAANSPPATSPRRRDGTARG